MKFTSQVCALVIFDHLNQCQTLSCSSTEEVFFGNFDLRMIPDPPHHLGRVNVNNGNKNPPGRMRTADLCFCASPCERMKTHVFIN